MPSVDLSNLIESHATRLEWFRQRAGRTTGYPAPLEDGTLLVSRPKGIFKPRDLDYALSVRINLHSPYPDGDVFSCEDGTWNFSYHQENPDPDQRDREYTNRALLRCIEDRVPVGVLRERVPDAENRDTYDVLGIAVPTSWDAGYFLFEGVRPDGTWHLGDTMSDVLVAEAERGLENTTEEPPGDDYDARLRVTRQIVARRGQPKFREALLDAYSRRCAVTGTDAESVLEAAHIRPYRGPESNVVANGLLLRADIHTLFDLALLAIQPGSLEIAISKALARSPYAELDGKPLNVPGDEAAHPSTEALQSTWDRYIEAEKAR